MNEKNRSEKTDKLITRKQIKSSYGSVRRALKDDIEIKPWKAARLQKIAATQRMKN